MNFLPSDEVAAIRDRLDHPVIDSDGHLIEYLPLVRDFLVEEADESVAQGFDRMVRSALPRVSVPDRAERRQRGIHSAGVWGIPTRNTLDRATVMLPGRGCCGSGYPTRRRSGSRAVDAPRGRAPRRAGAPT